ncbi:MAG: tRNA pseudouridine(55) synthase TruB [Bacteroidota bacterium]
MDYILESKPEGGWKWAMQAMLIAVTIQIFTTAIVFFTTSDGWQNPALAQEQVVEEIPLQLDESTPSSTGESEDGPMRNVMSQMDAEIGQVIRDNRGQGKDISPEEYAQQEFDRLHKAHQNDERAQPKQYDTPKTNPENDQPTSSTSYSGAVSVEWTLAGRSVSFGPKPTYRCKQAGVVKVNVMVNERGEVKSASIDPSSSQIQCLMDESLAHAKKWKFNADLGKVPQAGKIVFRFAAQ